MPAKQKAPRVFMFAGKCYLSTLLTKRGEYHSQTIRGNVVVRQQALSLLPRISQEKNQHILHETSQGSSAQLLQNQGCDLTHSITALPQVRNGCFDGVFSITCSLWTTTALWCDEKGAMSWKSIWRFGTNWKSSLGFLLLLLGAGLFNQWLFCTIFHLFWLCAVGEVWSCVLQRDTLSFSLQAELKSVKVGAVINTES